MENVISKYKDGDKLAEEELLDNIIDMFDDSISRDEAKVLLYKKYGKAKKF